jgi:tetraacyldisaccharide 4'-kinase
MRLRPVGTSNLWPWNIAGTGRKPVSQAGTTRVTGDRPQFVRAVMSGEDRSTRGLMLRAGLEVVEPVYAGVMAVRNRMFDRGLKKVHRLSKPVISIGNITTGGTGKTPVVRWVVERLREMGKRPAVLSRGYKSRGAGLGDELTMLDRMLNEKNPAPIFLAANPDRVAAAREVLGEHPEVDVFVLDDAFQHRRVARDLDVVLISAANPFGFGHVLPRGLLRERLPGLARADVFIITHADQATPDELAKIEATIGEHHATPFILRAVHAQTGLKTPDGQLQMHELRSRKFFVFAGIASPTSFERQLRAYAEPVGIHWFADHHEYTSEEVRVLRREAQAAGADVLLTTEKDWVKVANKYSDDPHLPPIWPVQMELQFLGTDEGRFISTLKSVVN